jgi:acyl carrier protein phosphodiesterase
MNWLAHLLLSEPTAEHRLGNILGDLVKGKERDNLNPIFQRGMECHCAIDSFTDSHAAVKRSKNRIDRDNRRYAGIIVDIFYDRILATNWRHYSTVSLDDFVAEIYTSFLPYSDELPEKVRRTISHMTSENWLGSYAAIAGIEKALMRIHYKLSLKRQISLDVGAAIGQLERQYDDFELDFREFFPEIIIYLQDRSKKSIFVD